MRGLEEVKIRLHGVDCPEKNQDFGTRAHQFAADLVFSREVEVHPLERDRYGRLVATVHCEGKSLGEELVRAGLAWWYRRYAPDDAVLEALEQEAREAGRGLWSHPHPLPPWEFRRGSAHTTPGRSLPPDQLSSLSLRRCA
jgi:endonuclease YncB( thermonuclease family)